MFLTVAFVKETRLNAQGNTECSPDYDGSTHVDRSRLQAPKPLLTSNSYPQTGIEITRCSNLSRATDLSS